MMKCISPELNVVVLDPTFALIERKLKYFIILIR